MTMKMKCLKAIAYKERIAVRRNIKSLLFIIVVFGIILLATSVSKCNTFLNAGVTDLKPLLMGSVSYVSMFLSYVAFMSTLKFWQEKSMDALDSLFSLPMSIRQVLTAKVMFSVYIGLLCFVPSYMISTLVFVVAFKAFAFSAVHFLAALVISMIFQFSYGVINGFCMWQLSVGAAKVAQIFTYVIFLGGIISLNRCMTPEGIQMNVVYMLCSALVLLIVGAVYALVLTNKEKIILNHID